MKRNQGITLVALIITIIVMLILVAVSVNFIVKSNLINTAEKAANGYKNAKAQEENIGNNPITINGKEYSSLDEYLAQFSGTAQDTVKWIYTTNEDGNIEITGIDLRGKKSEKRTDIGGATYGTITLKLANDTLIVPDKIEDKKVVSVSLTENIYDGMLETDCGWLTLSGVKNLIFMDGIDNIWSIQVVLNDMENIQLPKTAKNFNGVKSLKDTIINFPNGIDESLKIPAHKWGASKVIVEGEERDGLNWIYAETEDGKIEITGLDLSEMEVQVIGSEHSGYNIYLHIEMDTLKIPTKINGKNVVSFSLEDTILGSPRGGYTIWISSDFNITDVLEIIIPETVENVGTFKINSVNAAIRFNHLVSINFPNGKNEELIIPENKWGASKIIIEGVEQ